VPALKAEEALLVEEAAGCLGGEGAALARERFRALAALGASLARYPSDFERYESGGADAGALPGPLLHIPAKAAAVKGYLAAKYEAFSFLFTLARGEGEGEAAQFVPRLRQALLSAICALISGEVYLACLGDADFPPGAKPALTETLAALWENGSDPREARHLPALASLWKARDAAPPSFGTMEGSSELTRLSMDMESEWHGFIAERLEHDETRWALEEFLFGLSHEEIRSLRERLRAAGVTAVSRDEVRSFLGRRPAYGDADSADPRSLYAFYAGRRDAAAFRRKISASGPKRAVEEIYLKYCVAREEA